MKKRSIKKLIEETREAFSTLHQLGIFIKQYTETLKAQKSGIEIRNTNSIHMQAKKKEYISRNEQLINALHNNGISPDIMHKNLIKLNEEYKVVMKQVEQKMNVLKTYAGLPPVFFFNCNFLILLGYNTNSCKN